MKIIHFSTPITILYLIATCFTSASEKDTIGLTELLAREPGLNGSGIKIAMIEASSSSTSDVYQPSPAASSQPANKFSFFNNDFTYPQSDVYDSAKQSAHANLVANNYFDLNTGLATDVSEIFVFEAEHFANDIIGTLTNINAKIINQSFVFADINDPIDQFYDKYTTDYQTLFVNGLNNGNTTTISSPATSYNSISVGREDLNHSQGPTDNRSKPELIAPGSATSYATPYVAGSATILTEAALAPLEHGGAGTASTASDTRTIKALLINGATKDNTWTNTSTRPLDIQKGAGMLNINQAHLNLQGGKHSPTASANISPTATYTPPSNQSGNTASLIGWNFSTISNQFFGNRDRIDNYYFDIPATTSPTYDATATLTWHRQSNQTNINNLDLILFNANTGNIIQQSTSTVDNLEHIHTRDLPAGRYVLQVIKRKSANVSLSEDYALAFNFTTPAPDAPTNLTATPQANQSINLTWQDNSTDETTFELQRSTIATRLFNTIATLPTNTTTYTDTALAQSTTYYYRIKATNNNGDSFYSNVSSATTLNSIMSWRFTHFAIATDTGNAANSADPDKDGLTNIIEYALGTDPNSAAGPDGGAATPSASITTDAGTQYLQITINRASIKTDLNYIIQVSDDLLNWSTNTTTLENNNTTLRARDNLSIADHPRRFIRLKIEEN